MDNSNTGPILEQFQLLWQTLVSPKGHRLNFAQHRDVKCVCPPPIVRDDVDPVLAYLSHKKGDMWNVNNQSHQSKKHATNKTKEQEDGEETGDGCIRTCRCLVSAAGVTKNQPGCMFKKHFNDATFSTSLLPMHDGGKRKVLKDHSLLLWEVVDYKDICLFDQARLDHEQISVISGLIALLVFLFPNAKGNKGPSDSRIDVLRQIYKPFHEPGSVWDKSIKLFSSLKKHFECGFATSPNYQEFFCIKRGKSIEVKPLFHLEYVPAEGNEEKAIKFLKDALKGKLTGTIDNSNGLWVKNRGKVNGKLSPIMKKSSKIMEAVVKVLTQKGCECGNVDDYNEQMPCVQKELEDAISKTITTEIDDEDKLKIVSDLITIPVKRFAWTIQQRLVSLRYIVQHAEYKCFGGCGRNLAELARDCCISWEDYFQDERVTDEVKKKKKEEKRQMEDGLDFGYQICIECSDS